MFMYNLKLNGNRLIKFFFIVSLIIILIIFSIGIYNIFFKNRKSSSPEEDIFKITDTIKTDKIFELTENNYTNILQAVNENIDEYVGCKIHFVGYVYRVLDFTENQFVLARNMLVNENTNQSLVVGFLCTSNNTKDFKDGEWVDVTGTIVKGDYYGDIALVEVNNIFKTDEPKDVYVNPPSEEYIPTSGIL